MTDPHRPPAPGTSPAPAGAARPAMPIRDQKWAIVSAACIAGMMIGYGLAGMLPKPADWKRDAAGHQALYRSWTTLAPSPDPASLAADLDATAQGTGVPLPADTLTAVPGLTLRRVQALGVGEVGLAHLLFTDAAAMPYGLFVRPGAGGAAKAEADTHFATDLRDGLALVSWTGPRGEFLLIGRADLPEVEAHARALAAHLAGKG